MTQSIDKKLRIDDFDYELPQELIAQEPLEDRAASRLMVLDRHTGSVDHRMFRDLPSLLQPGDLLVMNDSRVIPARLRGHRESGGGVEVLILRPESDGLWRALAKPVRRLKVGERIVIPAKPGADAPDAHVVLKEKLGEGQVLVEIDDELSRHLEGYGHVPLPPYITHQLDDDERYQTVYANQQGSAAAPTAGLHFTNEMLAELAGQGIDSAYVTLHVGLDTFRPVSEEYAEDHEIHSEWCSVPQETWDKIVETKERGGRVVAVGTTSARTLESLGQRVEAGQPGPFDAFTRIYITPGYKWTMVDVLFTNFHLPKSTLLLMISALAGRENVLAAYQEAIAKGYRFFSFGDAMLIV
ncbi:MAG TPA: tRNA preQ1(34) S-adenosylmethionine ribosyltransferase-isomerase QueA [Thermomicrobiales bacterium]|nr:tRNA preQ1(34) S-adenosylmethionine ribosyltransferase-isomerase QueA [Thermomicrobiales bacterium]